MAYVGDGPKPELEIGDISTKDVTATGDLTVDTNTLFVDASENKVGIGTTTVTDGGVTITPSVTRAGDWDAKIALQSTAGSDFPALLFSGSNTTQYGGIVGTTDTSGNVANNRTAQIAFLQSSSTAGNITFSTNGDVGTTNVAERMRINSSGNVGIGLTDPDTPLEVQLGSSGNALKLSSSADGASVFLAFEQQESGTKHVRGRIRAASNGVDGGLIFETGASGSTSERLRILSAGGLTFNGDTATANALDDYEEGTWTPAITQGWTSVSYTNSYQFGKYTKIGNMVTAWFWLQFSGTSAGNQVILGGLPFTTPDANTVELAHRGGAVTYFNIPVNSAGAITAYTGGGSTTIQFFAFDDGGASALSNANASSDFLIGSVTYWVE